MIHWIQVSSGRGPEECCWVAAMVAERILGEAKAAHIGAMMIKAVPGTFANTYRSVLISVDGGSEVNAFLSRWQGTIKWIGKSPFRPEHRRKNWFVSVALFSPLAQKEWATKDIRFESMRSSGPGGQHANKTESAVRVRHLPTGLTAVASEERSQYANKKLAMVRLSRLLDEKDEGRRKEKEQQQWHHHNNLIRGNSVRVFKGRGFKER